MKTTIAPAGAAAFCDCPSDERIVTMSIERDHAHGVRDLIRFFCMHEQRIVTTHFLSIDDEEGMLCQNQLRIRADYQDGRLRDKIEVSMTVIFPRRLGQQFFLGMDISPGAKTPLSFIYTRSGDDFELTRFERGMRAIDLTKQPEALVFPQDFPFPVERTLSPMYGTHGGYQVPILVNHAEGTIVKATVPCSLREHG